MVGKLIKEASSNLDMLGHMIKINILDCVVWSVDMRVVVAKWCLEEKCRREAVPVGRGVVGTGVAAGRLLVRDIGVLVDKDIDELVLPGVGKVGDEAKALVAIMALSNQPCLG